MENDMKVGTCVMALTGQRFGNLTYIRPVGRRGGSLIWVCVCDCGRLSKVVSGKRHTTKSCDDSCPTQSKRAIAALTGIWTCDIHGEVEAKWYGSDIICVTCVNDKRRVRNQVRKQRAVDFLGGVCMGCGYYRCIAALDFHHRDPSEKEFRLAGKTAKWSVIEAELLKCDLLCANCHREHHYSEGVDNE